MLTSLVHNDFRQSHGLIPLFDGLEVQEIEKPLHVIKDLPILNGNTPHTSTTDNTQGAKTAQV